MISLITEKFQKTEHMAHTKQTARKSTGGKQLARKVIAKNAPVPMCPMIKMPKMFRRVIKDINEMEQTSLYEFACHHATTE